MAGDVVLNRLPCLPHCFQVQWLGSVRQLAYLRSSRRRFRNCERTVFDPVRQRQADWFCTEAVTLGIWELLLITVELSGSLRKD